MILSWYRGRYVFNNRNLAQWIAASKKDYHFRVRHKDQAEKTVVSFVYSDQVKKDRRLYSPCRQTYEYYKDYCNQQGLEPLTNRQFKLASATGKALIVGDDNNPNDYNKTSENFKSVATGENVLINPKGSKPFNYRFHCFIVQSMNGIPRFKDTSDALFRRFRVLVFNHQYPADAHSKLIKSQYIKDRRLLEFMLKKSLGLDFGTLQDTKESQQAIKTIKQDNDNVDYFIDNYLDKLKSQRVPVKYLFYYFLAAMERENNPQTMKQNTFTNRAKPLMEKVGWEYSRNNLAPLEFWNKADTELLNKLDIGYKYHFKVDTKAKQPLFKKQQRATNHQK